MKASASKLMWPRNLRYHGACSVTRSLVEWCSSNIQCKRHFKQKQLYIHGPPNTLKTSFLDILIRYCTSFEIPATEDFLDLYGDPEPELCYIDEFCAGKLTINWWNQFLQGSTPQKALTLKQKGKQSVKETNPPVVMISNRTLEENWANALLKNHQALAPLYVRLTVVEVTQPLDIQGFLEAIASATYATTPPPTIFSDADLTTVLSEQLSISQPSQEEEVYLNLTSPALFHSQKSKRPRLSPLAQQVLKEVQLSIDTETNQLRQSTSDPVQVAVSSLEQFTTTTSTALSASVSNNNNIEELRMKFKKHRKAYDDYLIN